VVRRFYLAAYDIRTPKRLRRALKVTRAFATGGQKSAYECWLNDTERQLLLDNMQLVIDPDEDQFSLIPLDPRRPAVGLGTAQISKPPGLYYFA